MVARRRLRAGTDPSGVRILRSHCPAVPQGARTTPQGDVGQQPRQVSFADQHSSFSGGYPAPLTLMHLLPNLSLVGDLDCIDFRVPPTGGPLTAILDVLIRTHWFSGNDAVHSGLFEGLDARHLRPGSASL